MKKCEDCVEIRNPVLECLVQRKTELKFKYQIDFNQRHSLK